MTRQEFQNRIELAYTNERERLRKCGDLVGLSELGKSIRVYCDEHYSLYFRNTMEGKIKAIDENI